MSLVLTSPSCDPEILTPSGGRVRFFFNAMATNNDPTHMRACFSIDEGEPFVFVPPEGGSAKHVYYPGFTKRKETPGKKTPFGPKTTTIAPKGRADGSRSAPLKITVTLEGFDSAGNPDPQQVRTRFIEITMDPVSMALELPAKKAPEATLAKMDPVTAALRLVSTSLGVTQVQIGRVLKVHPDTIGRVLRGENSPKVREALERIFKGK